MWTLRAIMWTLRAIMWTLKEARRERARHLSHGERDKESRLPAKGAATLNSSEKNGRKKGRKKPSAKTCTAIAQLLPP
eukprot:3192831-Pyramimonas_sp.AAC.1